MPGWQVADIPSLVAGVAIAGLGAWVLALGWRNGLHRAFALLAATLATTSITHGLSESDLGVQVFVLALVAQPFAAVHFALEFLPGDWVRQREARGVLWAGRLALLGGYLALAAVFLSDGTLGLWLDGPFARFQDIAPAVFCAVALGAGATFLATPKPQRLEGTCWFAIGFLLHPVYFLTFRLANAIPDAWATPTGLLATGGLLCAVALVFLFARDALRHPGPGERRRLRWLVLLPGLAGATAIVAWQLPTDAYPYMHLGFQALWRLAFVAAVAFALVRHTIFTLRPGFSALVRDGGTLSMIGVLFWFIEQSVSGVLQMVLPAGDSLLERIGGEVVAAAVAVSVFWPVRKMCARFAEQVSPRRASPQRRRHCQAIYRAAYRQAARYGGVDGREREALRRLAQTLRLQPDEVRRLQAPTRPQHGRRNPAAG